MLLSSGSEVDEEEDEEEDEEGWVEREEEDEDDDDDEEEEGWVGYREDDDREECESLRSPLDTLKLLVAAESTLMFLSVGGPFSISRLAVC